MKKSILGALLIGATTIACAPAVVAPPTVPIPTPDMDVSATPVYRGPGGHTVAHARVSDWGSGPAALPPGAQMVVLEGDPSKAELFTIRLRLPNNYVVRPHYHSTWEHITVISGVLHLGMGDTFSMAGATELRAGSFSAMPDGMRHFVHAAGETVVQLHGLGPWTVTYVNPADDPRRR